MAHTEDERNRVKRLIQKGYSQEEIEELTGISARVQRDWKKKGLMGNKHKEEEQPNADYVWTDITAADLLKAGVNPEVAPMIIASLGIARQQGNVRAHRYVKTLFEVSERWPNMPEAWRGLLAGFPIIADDIDAPSMKELAQLAKELHPYLNKQLRREYHRRVQPILLGVLAEVQSFIVDAANTVDATTGKRGFPLTIWPTEALEPRRRLWQRKPEDGRRMGATEAQSSLVKGQWGYMIPEAMQSVPIESTWAGTLYDIVSRLPDPDRQRRGKVLGKRQLSIILHTWCFTAPGDFVPPLLLIDRRDRSNELGPTGLFLRWKAQAEGERSEEKQPWLVEPTAKGDNGQE